MKKFILGFVTAAMIFGSVGTYAATTNQINVLWNVKSIKFDGVTKNSSSKAFTYNNTQYVPLKFIGDNFNKVVSYDKTSQSVLVNTPKPKVTYLGDTVKHMNYQKDNRRNGSLLVYNSKEIFNDGMSKRTTVKDNLGTAYKNFVLMYKHDYAPDPSTNFIEFPLISKYKQFTTTVGIEDKYQDSSAITKVEFLLDGNEIKTLEFKGGDFPQSVTLNVENGKKLTLQVTTDKDESSIIFGNPILK